MKNIPMIVTHSESFHLDEVTAIALLAKLGLGVDNLYELNIIRTRSEKELNKYKRQKDVYVIDVGNEYLTGFLNFDHHQNDPNLIWEENEKPSGVDFKGRPFLLSSCGLIWKYLLKNSDLFSNMKKLTIKQKETINNLVKRVDLCDNGIETWHFAPLVFTFNLYGENVTEENRNIQFKKALVEMGRFIDILINDEKDEYDKDLVSFTDEVHHFINYKEETIPEDVCKEFISLTERHKKTFNQYIVLANKKTYNSDVRYTFYRLFENLLRTAKANVKAEIEIKKALDEAKKVGNKDILFFKNDNFNARQLTAKYSDDGLIIATYEEKEDKWTLTLVNKNINDPYTGRISMPAEWAGKTKKEIKEISGFDNIEFAHKGRFIIVMKGTKEEVNKVCKEIINLSN